MASPHSAADAHDLDAPSQATGASAPPPTRSAPQCAHSPPRDHREHLTAPLPHYSLQLLSNDLASRLMPKRPSSSRTEGLAPMLRMARAPSTLTPAACAVVELHGTWWHVTASARTPALTCERREQRACSHHHSHPPAPGARTCRSACSASSQCSVIPWLTPGTRHSTAFQLDWGGSTRPCTHRGIRLLQHPTCCPVYKTTFVSKYQSWLRRHGPLLSFWPHLRLHLPLCSTLSGLKSRFTCRPPPPLPPSGRYIGHALIPHPRLHPIVAAHSSAISCHTNCHLLSHQH